MFNIELLQSKILNREIKKGKFTYNQLGLLAQIMSSLTMLEPSMPNASSASAAVGASKSVAKPSQLVIQAAATPDEALDFSMKKSSVTNGNRSFSDSRYSHQRHTVATLMHSPADGGSLSSSGASSSDAMVMTPFMSDDCASSINSNSTR